MGIIMFVIMLAITLPVLAFHRYVLGNRVQALMRKESPATDSTSAIPHEAQAAEATTTLQILQLDDGAMSTDDDKARYAQTQHSRTLFGRSTLYDAIGIVSVLALMALFYMRDEKLLALVLAGVGVGFLILIGLRYAFYVGQYKDRAIRGTEPRSKFRRWIVVMPEALIRVYFHPRYSFFPLLAIVGVLYVSGKPLPSGPLFLWLVLLVFVPLMLRIHLIRRAKNETNRRLLILRVFGRDESTALTFGAIRNYWQHIGSTFTLGDASYLKHKYRGHSENQIVILFFSLIIGLNYDNQKYYPEWDEWGTMIGGAIVLSIIISLGYLVYFVGQYLLGQRSFAKTAPQIEGRLQGFLRRPHRWDLTFRDLDMYCYENTWRDAVSTFAASSDVVLMDLRGYSHKNRGCDTEIDYLFDNYPIERIVFLVNSGNEMREVDQLLGRCWQFLKADSPNRTIAEPTAKVYDINGERAQDVKGLINTLVACTTTQQYAEARSPSEFKLSHNDDSTEPRETLELSQKILSSL